MKTRHTPLPWVMTDDFINVHCAESGALIASLDSAAVPDDSAELSKANAAFIVKAVNSHDEMVEALGAIVARINGDYDNPILMKRGALSHVAYEDIEDIARTALAKAKE